jgi:hypothetical protein
LLTGKGEGLRLLRAEDAEQLRGWAEEDEGE